MKLFCITVLLSLGLLNLAIASKEDKEYDYVDVDEIKHHEHGMDMKLNAFGKHYDLRLEKRPSVLSKNFKFFTIQDGVVKEDPFQGEHPEVYVDSKSNTVLHVDSKGEKVKLEGVLSGDISLVSTQGIRSDKSALAFRALNKEERISYKLSAAREELNNTFSYYKADKELAVPEVVRPELMVVVDYTNFKQLDFSKEKMIKYISIFWHTVNTIYELIDKPRVQLMVTGVLGIPERKMQPFVEQGLKQFPSGKELLDLNICLPGISIFLYGAFETLGYFDIGMLMTGEDMAVAPTPSSPYMPEVAGVAPLSGACTVDAWNHMLGNVGMAEDKMPYYDGIYNHAHEVAHLLGAAHDGDEPPQFLPGHPGAADCPWDEGYLMSYKFGTKNHVRWSPCTIEQIRWKINNPKMGMCLRDEPIGSVVNDTKVLSGELISLDEQCQAMLGKNGKHFKFQNKAEVCVVLFCSEGENANPVARGPAIEGTPCGYGEAKKWCIHGECVKKQT